MTPTYDLNLFFQCQDLLDMDLLSKSDPRVELSKFDFALNKFVHLGKTECIKNTRNPTFLTPIPVKFHFDTKQSCEIVLNDVDTRLSSSDVGLDFIGSTRFDLAEVVTSPGMMLQKQLQTRSGKNGGLVIIRGEPSSGCRDVVHFRIQGMKMDRKDIIGLSDPYLIIEKNNNGVWMPVHKTEVRKVTLNPEWDAFSIGIEILCNSDLNKPLRFTVMDWDKLSTDEFIGSLEVTLNELLLMKANSFAIKNPNKKKKDGISGYLNFPRIDIEKKYSFLDYLRGGCELTMMVAVDFTGSNGNPLSPNSLHYRDPNGMSHNQYTQAIRCVGDIISYYDSKKMFPSFGFGARLPTRNGPVVSHCFSLNGNPSNPYCFGTQGVLQAYQQALSSVELYGPTYFSSIIAQASQLANNFVCQDVQKYTVLLLITDGVLNDVKRTIDEIVKASNLPLSIVIVGVGNADFSQMNVLDGDSQPLVNSSGVTRKRDIVQFVPFNVYKKSIESLSQQVLGELPRQVEEYFQSHGIVPNASTQL